MKIYNRRAVITHVAGMARLTQGQAESAVNALEELVVEACHRGDDVELECGQFKKIEKNGVQGIVFRQATSVKEYLNERAD